MRRRGPYAHPDAAAIDNGQPYKARKGSERYALELISGLAIMDKHHRPHASVVLVDRASINWFKVEVGQSGAFLKNVLIPADVRQRISDADLMAFEFEPPNAEIKVSVDESRPLPIAIEFRNGSPFCSTTSSSASAKDGRSSKSPDRSSSVHPVSVTA